MCIVNTYHQRSQWKLSGNFQILILNRPQLKGSAHLSHRRPPKPSLHRHDPAGWPVNQAHTKTHTQTRAFKKKKQQRVTGTERVS